MNTNCEQAETRDDYYTPLQPQDYADDMGYAEEMIRLALVLDDCDCDEQF
jgi:hypothetical protein